MKNKIWPRSIIEKKKQGEKIVVLTAYDYLMAKLLEEVGVDIILVGDSVGNVFCGLENTLPVTMEQMIYHTKAVVRGSKRALVIADMPYLSYQVSPEKAKWNAGRLLKEGGAQAVKVEICSSDISYLEEIVKVGIPVMGHIGFTPQSTFKLGGYRVQGKTEEASEMILKTAKRLEEIGCFALVLEMVPANLAKKISQALTIPTIGIGAGPFCDGQVLVTQDLLGIDDGFTPKFVKKYANLNKVMKKALKQYKKDVLTSEFPDEVHSF